MPINIPGSYCYLQLVHAFTRSSTAGTRLTLGGGWVSWVVEESGTSCTEQWTRSNGNSEDSDRQRVHSRTLARSRALPSDVTTASVFFISTRWRLVPLKTIQRAASIKFGLRRNTTPILSVCHAYKLLPFVKKRQECVYKYINSNIFKKTFTQVVN